MIDLNKKYTTVGGYEVVLYDIVDNTVFGRYLDPEFNIWIPDKWNVLTGKNCSVPTANKWHLVEIVEFNIAATNTKWVYYYGIGVIVPVWANWICTDKNGTVWCYEDKPEIREYGEFGNIGSNSVFQVFDKIQYNGDWRTSLMEIK